MILFGFCYFNPLQKWVDVVVQKRIVGTKRFFMWHQHSFCKWFKTVLLIIFSFWPMEKVLIYRLDLTATIILLLFLTIDLLGRVCLIYDVHIAIPKSLGPHLCCCIRYCIESTSNTKFLLSFHLGCWDVEQFIEFAFFCTSILECCCKLLLSPDTRLTKNFFVTLMSPRNRRIL